jgi:replication factor A1
MTAVQEIKNRFSQLGAELSEEEIQHRLERLTQDFKVPIEEAKRSVTNYFLKEHNLDKSQYYAGLTDNIVSIQDINQEGQWITLKVKVAQLWQPNHESIVQTGLIGDETGVIKFTMFQGVSIQQLLEEGKSYQIKNAVTSIWQGRYQINLNRATEIVEIEEDIKIGSTETEFTGVIVDVQSGSGLIKRCPDCNKALTKGACTEHGKVEGIYDLRIKAVVDDGQNTQDVIVNRELTEQLTNITLDEAKNMATEALDHSVVKDAIKSKIIGRYYTIIGIKIDRYLIAKNIQQTKISKETVDKLQTQILSETADTATAQDVPQDQQNSTDPHIANMPQKSPVSSGQDEHKNREV